MNGRVAVWVAPGQPFEYREYPVPDPEADAIIVRMRACNICGSDLHLWRGDVVAFEVGVPQILGHEMVGTVERLGCNVRCDASGESLREGDRIIYSYACPCGTCPYCLDRSAPCPKRNSHWIGVSSDKPPHFNAGYGEFYYLRPGQSVFRVSDELSDDLVSPVNCAGAQVVTAMRRVQVASGDSVLIQGAGGLGLFAVAMCREAGVKQIIVLDGHAGRLELAREFGADRTLNVAELRPEDRLERVLEWTDGLGADVAFEFAGVPEAVPEGVRLLRPAGRYAVAGNISHGFEARFDPTELVRRNLRMHGVHGYHPWAIPAALEFLARTKHKYPFDAMISHHFAFDSINDAFALADRGDAIRVSVTF